MRTLTKTLSLLVVLALAVGAASAGCGVKDTTAGTLKSVDADSKTVVVAAGDKEVKLKVTEKTTVTDAEGNETKLSSLVGKEVEVISEHAEVDSIKQIA